MIFYATVLTESWPHAQILRPILMSSSIFLRRFFVYHERKHLVDIYNYLVNLTCNIIGGGKTWD